MVTFKAIAAMASNRVIGRDNRLPWHLPEELQHFRQTTLHQTLLMGRKTFESMDSRPLPKRTTYVLTHRAFPAENVHVITDISQIPATAKIVWICGGASIYAQLLPLCDELLLSVISKTYGGDAFFPPFEHLFKKAEVIKETETFEVQRWIALRKTAVPQKDVWMQKELPPHQ